MFSLHKGKLFFATIITTLVIGHPWLTGNKYSTLTVVSHRKTRRGTKAGRRNILPIETVVSDRNDIFPSCNFYQRPFYCNLKQLPSLKVDNANDRCDKFLSLFTMNCRSVKNKTISVCDFISSNNADIVALTKTWLGTSIDTSVIAELLPDGYIIVHIPRRDRRVGGCAVIFKSTIDVSLLANSNPFTHFELLDCSVKINTQQIRLCVIYRPPQSKSNNHKIATFFEEWSTFLDNVVVSPDELVITGDLNFHLDNAYDRNASIFTETLDDHGLTQNVVGATHIHGHTLDVVITRDDSSILLINQL